MEGVEWNGKGRKSAEKRWFNKCRNLSYHSKGEMSGHLRNMYMPLLYLKLEGLTKCRESTFPG